MTCKVLSGTLSLYTTTTTCDKFSETFSNRPNTSEQLAAFCARFSSTFRAALGGQILLSYITDKGTFLLIVVVNSTAAVHVVVIILLIS